MREMCILKKQMGQTDIDASLHNSTDEFLDP